LQFTKKYAPIGTDDYQFRQGLGEVFYELLSNKDRIMKQYLEISRPFGHKIGGYPDFIQGDARWVITLIVTQSQISFYFKWIPLLMMPYIFCGETTASVTFLFLNHNLST
jgi:hypothetical protein